jgi:O-antigen ligase/tetratricopeptide (TPR) repeat protein
LFGGVLLVIFQILPLPAWLLSKISGTTLEILPLWSDTADAAARLGRWNHISFTPVATQGGLVMYLTYGILFLLVVQRLRSLEDVQRLIRWIALAAIFMATIGLLQLLLGNGAFLWIYEHPSRTTDGAVKGTFANQNHFAQFLALGVGPLIWWIWHSLRHASSTGRARTKDAQADFSPTWSTRRLTHISAKWSDHSVLRQLLFVGLGIVILAGLLTFSRGGVLALFVAVTATSTIYFWKRLLGKKSLVIAAGTAFLIGVSLLIYGAAPLASRLSTFREASSVGNLSQARRDLWRAHIEAIPNFVWFGTGVGSHREVYPVFLKEHFDVEFTHGESGYLQLLLESGLAGFLGLVLGIALVIRWCLRCLRGPYPDDRGIPFLACGGAIVGGIAASLVQSIGDFVWYIPACMSLTVLLVACACRLSQLCLASRNRHTAGVQEAISRRPGGEHLTLTRPGWICLACGMLMIAFAMLWNRVPSALAAPHLDRYRALALEAPTFAGVGEEAEETAAPLARHLEQVLTFNPNSARANVRMAALLLQRFDREQKHAMNPMSLSQIRDAALASGFPNRQALHGWLDVAVGSNRELLDRALQLSRRGLELCPLQGEGYIYLAELSFLENPAPVAKDLYISQALQVRPHSGIVHFAAGKEAALQGDVSRAMAHWKRGFHQDPEVQTLIIDTFASRLPAALFVSEFQPRVHGLSKLFDFYSNAGRVEDAQVAAGVYVQALEAEAEAATDPNLAAEYWHRAQEIRRFLGDYKGALTCQLHAVELDPKDIQKRQSLAALLIHDEQYQRAQEHIHWCLRRKPNDSKLREMLALTNRQQRMPKLRSAADTQTPRPRYH